MLKEHNPTANPLAVFNMRKMDFCPVHFERLEFKQLCETRALLNWIYENTEGRFYLRSDGAHRNTEIGFETHSEATYFSIMMHSFNKDIWA